MSDKKMSRRDLLKIGTAGALGVAGSFYLNNAGPFSNAVKAATSFVTRQKSFCRSHHDE